MNDSELSFLQLTQTVSPTVNNVPNGYLSLRVRDFKRMMTIIKDDVYAQFRHAQDSDIVRSLQRMEADTRSAPDGYVAISVRQWQQASRLACRLIYNRHNTNTFVNE